MADVSRLPPLAGGLPDRPSMRDVRLYVCTDARRRQGDLKDFLDTILAAGVDAVQLRDKSLDAADELSVAAEFQSVCGRYGRPFSINDRADIAAAVHPEILHLGQRDLPVVAARAILGADIMIGRSTHAQEEVVAASEEDGVDYFCVGPVWPTPTKPGRPAPGLGLLRSAASVAPPDETGAKPWFAIGGVDLTTLDEVLDAGARRVVVVRAITDADDPGAAAAEFARRLADAAAG